MKLTAILLLTACLGVSAKGLAQKVTLSVKNGSLQTVFREVIRQTGISIVYNEEIFEGATAVTIQVKDATVQEVMDKCLAGQPFSYRLESNKIIILKKDKAVGLQPIAPPPINVKGRILNENGEPVLVSIQVKGTGKGTTTNNDGYFELRNVDGNATLIISATNIETREIKLNGKNDLDVVHVRMKIENMNEVVINKGYYTERQKFSVGNTAKITAKDIEKQPVNNPLLALEGRVPGLFITQSTGIPGGGITVRIQGQNSLERGNDPLYVIDGVPYISQLLPDLSGPAAGILGSNGNNNPFTQVGGGNPLSYINPSDIESIEILKDADATAIYGSRAAAGAILITTKKGKAGQTKVDVNYQHGWGRVAHFLTLLNTQQYLLMRHEAKANDNASILPTDYDLNGTWDTTRYTDWQKELIGGTAQYRDAQVSVSGGNNNTQFLIATNYHKETTVFPGDLADNKGAVHFNINNISSNQKFKIQFSSEYIYDNNQLINKDLTSTAIQLAPVAPSLLNSDGTLNWAPRSNGTSSWYNPLAYFNGEYNKTVKNNITNAVFDYQIFPGISIKTNLGYNNMQIDEVSINPSTTKAPELIPTTLRFSQFAMGSTYSWIVEPQINYNHKFKDGVMNVLFGSTFLQSHNDMKAFDLTVI